MNKVWVRSQDGKKLLLIEEFEVHPSPGGGAVVNANCMIIARYDSMERALEVLDEIEDQLRKGNCFDDMYQHRRVSKQNIYHMPKE